MNEKVSIVIPTYGGGSHLARAIDSVLNQTYPYLEIIVVDDNGLGTENQLATEKILQKYKNDERVKYYCHTVNINGSAARNTGVNHSNGTFIGLLDDDDEYLPNKVEKQVEILRKANQDVALTYCSHELYSNNKKIGEKHVYLSGFLLYELLIHSVAVGSSSFLIRRRVWDEFNGFDESFRRHQDWEFTARVASKYKIIADDFIGFKRNLEFRNSAKSASQVKKYREHYLAKMKPYIDMLPYKEQNNVYAVNRVDVAIQYAKERNIKRFIKEYHDAHSGVVGIKMLVRRILKYAKLI